jgi:PAS domain S-box-containing protein
MHYFNYSFTALRNDSGEIYGVMNTAADVTDIVLLKQQYEALSEELVVTNEELAAANEELSSANEEMAATNEELITTNEELSRSTIQREALYNELAQSRNDLLFAIDAAGLATFDLDPVTNRLTGNDLLKLWFGLKPEDEIDFSKAADAIMESDRKSVEAAIRHSMEYHSGGNYDVEYTIINPIDGGSRMVRAKGKALFNDQKEPVRLSGTVQDITEQKKNEQRKNDFIGMVSHELKTPLTSLSAYIQLLETKLKGEESFTFGALSQCRKQVSKMTTMINGFLNVSRLESSQIQIDKRPFDMADLMKEVAEEALTTISSHEVIFAPVEPTPVFADWDKIGQVVNNFISNAVKYSPSGSIINVACITTGETVQVSVKDRGMGIKAGDLEKLFDRYYRVENPNTKHISGFGIGLYLCKEIMLRHNGKIFAESELGKGTVFYFTLPLRTDENAV